MGRKKITQQRREQIIAALYDCLAETGHENVTVKKIAARAGLTHGAIHYYFANKDEIIEALVLSLMERYEAEFNAVLRGNHALEELISILRDRFLEVFIFDKRLNRVFVNLTQMSFERERVRLKLKKLFRAYRSNLRKFNLLAGMEEKEAELLAMGLTALVDGLSLQRTVDGRAVDRDKLNDLVNLLVRVMGLLPHPGE